MKKALFFLAVLCVVGIFTAKAQSPSDSAYARDLSYTYINANTLPASASGTLTNTDKLLKDIRPGKVAKGFTFVLSQATTIDIILKSSTSFNSYLLLLDANYNELAWGNSYFFSSGVGCRIIRQLPAGTYNLIVSRYASGRPSSSLAFTLDLASSSAVPLSSLTYTPKSINSTFTDTLGRNSSMVIDSLTFFQNGQYPHCVGYRVQLQPSALSVTVSRYGRNLYVLDNNYNLVDFSTYSTNLLTEITTAGTYNIVVASAMDHYDDDTAMFKPFTLSINTSSIESFQTLTYSNINIGDTTNDTLVATDPLLSSHTFSYRHYARGYRVQTGANTHVLDVKVLEEDPDMYMFLLDANKNLIQEADDCDYGSFGSRLTSHVNPSTTYYIVLSTYGELGLGGYKFVVEGINSLPVYYVDGINGNDSRNGLTPSTALKTLDTAVARSGRMGKYYLTEDYTFSSNGILPYFAEIYPYQKDIRLKVPSSGSDLIYALGTLTLGEKGGNYYFILDSVEYNYYFIYGGYLDNYLYINNLKIRNSTFYDRIFSAKHLTMHNCEFTNDTIDNDFSYFSYRYSTLSMENTNISQCIIDDDLFDIDDEHFTFEMKNSTVAGNTFGNAAWFNEATLNLTSGNWRNNHLSSNFSPNGNANLSTQNCAGIWGYYTTINIGAGFTMDANNYLCIDSSSRVNITENLSGNNVAQVYPFDYDYDVNKFVGDYYEGRRVLSGSTSLLANSYQKFSIAQADNSSLWYIHPDGTIHTYPVSIVQAEEGTIRLYPNPANNVLNIALQGTEVNEAVIIDIYGKTVTRTAVAEGNNTLNISALPLGMYFVQLRADNSVKATQKIIKR